MLVQIQTRNGAPEALHPSAHALRPARILREDLRHYTGTTFPSGPFKGCALYLRRLSAFGHIGTPNADQWVDVLDEKGDILQEVPVTRKGFEQFARNMPISVLFCST